MRVIQDSEGIRVDGKYYPYPPHVKSKFNNSLSIYDDYILVNGWKFDRTTCEFEPPKFYDQLPENEEDPPLTWQELGEGTICLLILVAGIGLLGLSAYILYNTYL